MIGWLRWHLGWFRYHLYDRWRRDECEICHGKRGGRRGNESVITTVVSYTDESGKICRATKRVVMCDFCRADTWPMGMP